MSQENERDQQDASENDMRYNSEKRGGTHTRNPTMVNMVDPVIHMESHDPNSHLFDPSDGRNSAIQARLQPQVPRASDQGNVIDYMSSNSHSKIMRNAPL